MKHLISATLAALLGITFSAATFSATPEEAIKFRQGVFNAQKWNMITMGEIVKGDKPYDHVDFAKRADNLAALSKIFIEGFSYEGANKGESGAKPEIWLALDKFKSGADKLGVETAKLAQAAQGSDFKAIKMQFGEVQKTCKGCHDNFRNK